MGNRCISDGMIDEENLLIGEGDEASKVDDSDDKLMSKSGPDADEMDEAELQPVASSHVAN